MELRRRWCKHTCICWWAMGYFVEWVNTVRQQGITWPKTNAIALFNIFFFQHREIPTQTESNNGSSTPRATQWNLCGQDSKFKSQWRNIHAYTRYEVLKWKASFLGANIFLLPYGLLCSFVSMHRNSFIRTTLPNGNFPFFWAHFFQCASASVCMCSKMYPIIIIIMLLSAVVVHFVCCALRMGH